MPLEPCYQLTFKGMGMARRQVILSDNMAMSDLCQHLKRVSLAIANAIDALSDGQTMEHKRLKRLLVTSLWLPLEDDAESIIRHQDSKESLPRIASSLERLLDEELEVIGTMCKDSASRAKIIHPIPRQSNIDECIRELEAWEKARKTTKGRKAPSTTHAMEMHDDPNPRSIQHPEPMIDYKVLQGESSIHSRTELLFTCLHQHWPCRVEGHWYEMHKGKLGHCKSAKFCIGPSWNLDKNVDAFSVILLGDNVLQECNVTIRSSR